MNKNLLRTCIGITIGGSLLVTSTVMGIASGPTGYETLKAILKNSDNLENATYSMSGSLMDNNKELIKLNSTFKVQQDELVSGNIFIDTDKLDRNYIFSANDKTMIFKHDASDVYNKITRTEKELEIEKKHNVTEYENPQMEAICENILDTLVGDLKNQVTLKNLENDRKQISINLDKNEIPNLFNLILNLRQNEESNFECKTNNNMSEIFGINPHDFEFPELTSNIQAEEVNIEIVVDKDNAIKELDLEFEVVGNDTQKSTHNQTLKISFDISNINSTTADVIDLAGKEVNEISTKDLSCNEN